LTYLLFLKMADEQTKPPFNKSSSIPKGIGWETLIKLDGDDLEIHLASQARHKFVAQNGVVRSAHRGPPHLKEMGKRPGMPDTIFRKAQNEI
jgi:type I restriction enzyme M protein